MTRTPLLFGFLGFFACLGVGQPALAQEEDLEVELFFAPAETVTSAARHAQPLELSPSAVTVLTRTDIEASGARTLPEVLRLVPNMDIEMVKPIWYSVGVRGGTTEASDSLLLLVDGRDVTFELFGAPLWAVQHFSMDDVERIEIIRGPGSALYGANAYSGVVHVITRQPGQGPTASVSVRGGEHGSIEMSGRGTAVFGPVAVTASTGWVKNDLWTGRGIPGLESVRGMLQGQFDLGTDHDLLLESGAYLTDGHFHADIGEIDLKDMIDVFARGRYTWADMLTVQAVYDRVTLESDLGMNLFYKDLGILLAEVAPIDGVFQKAGGHVQFDYEIFHNRFAVGAEYIFNSYHAEVFADPDHSEHRLGTYLQYELALGAMVNELAKTEMPPLYVTLGVRYDRNWRDAGSFDMRDWVSSQEISPRASVVFVPWTDHSFRVGYAHAFLKPTFFESSLHLTLIDVSNLGFTDLNVANPDLANQTIDSVEFGYAAAFLGDRLELKVDFAYNWYRNSIGFEYDPDQIEYLNIGGFLIPDLNGPGLGFVNSTDGNDGHNLDIQLVGRPTEHSRLFVTTGYRQVIVNSSGDFAQANPVWHLAMGADWGTEMGFTASFRAFYTSSHNREVGHPDGILEGMVVHELPDYWLLNVRVAYRFDTGDSGLTIGLEGFNLLDRQFRELGGYTRPNAPDYAGERLARRITFFVQGEI